MAASVMTATPNTANTNFHHLTGHDLPLDAVPYGSGQVNFGVASAVDVAQAAGQWVGAGRRAGYGRFGWQ